MSIIAADPVAPADYVLDEAGNALPINRQVLDAGAGATTELVAAVAARKIRVVFAVALAGGTATTLVFKSATAAISPTLANGANGGAVLPRNDLGWFETASGAALNVTTGAGSATGILVGYVLVP